MCIEIGLVLGEEDSGQDPLLGMGQAAMALTVGGYLWV
jgi:hypothetical protein